MSAVAYVWIVLISMVVIALYYLIYSQLKSKGKGGGVCQVSSTLYLASIKSGLQITKRFAHTVTPDCAPLGLDATVSYGQQDLVIYNLNSSPITLQACAR